MVLFMFMTISEVLSSAPLSTICIPDSCRSVTADDWERFRDLRLQALREEPKAYGIAEEDVIHTSDEEWKTLCKDAAEGAGKWYFVAEHDGKLIAMVGATRVFGKYMRHQVEICHAYVAEGFRGQGIMTRLFTALKAHLQKVEHLEQMIAWVTLHETQTSKYLFEKLGFTLAGTLSKTVKYEGEYYDCCWLEAPINC